MTAFAGIDYDTRGVHIVGIYEDDPRAYYWCFELEGHDAFERARDVRVKMPSRSWWENHAFVGCAIEEQRSYNPAMRATTMLLKMTQGAILSCIPRDLVIAPRDPGEWRTDVGLSGRASKEDIALFVRNDLRSDPDWPQDACDAFCLALAAEKLTVPA